MFNSSEPNSLEANASPEIRALIKRKRAEANADARSFEMWARTGYGAGAEWADKGLMAEERKVLET